MNGVLFDCSVRLLSKIYIKLLRVYRKLLKVCNILGSFEDTLVCSYDASCKITDYATTESL